MVTNIFPRAFNAFLIGKSCQFLLIRNNEADNVVLVTGGQREREREKRSVYSASAVLKREPFVRVNIISYASDKAECKPVCVSADVVNERAVLQR